MKLTPWLVILSLCLVACSGSKSAQKVNEEPPQIELSDADEFIENPTDAPSDTPIADAAAPETLETEPAPEATAADASAADATPEAVVAEDEVPVVLEDDVTPEVAVKPAVDAGTIQTYKVEKNETLMMIAFKLYGDYGKWKDLVALNEKALKNGHTVWAGMNLKYAAPARDFVWNPQGLPYLIRTGDTLGGISKTVYTTPKKWKLIWENNKPLIKNPNLIFAGFTIYYLENGREVANEI